MLSPTKESTTNIPIKKFVHLAYDNSSELFHAAAG
jgi:hypothetical protein